MSRSIAIAAAAAALALAGVAAGSVPRPSISAIAASNQGRTLTITGTGLNRLRSIHVGDHTVGFKILSPRKVRTTVPLNWQPNGTLISLAFAKITISWKKCSSCTDQWGPSG